MSKVTTTKSLLEQVNTQVQFMHSCGRTRLGYVTRYGKADSHDKYGEGGDAIYNADAGATKELLLRLAHRLGVTDALVLSALTGLDLEWPGEKTIGRV